MDAIMVRWRRLSTTLADNAQKIQELMAKLMQFEVGRIRGLRTCGLRAQPKLGLGVHSGARSSFFQNDVKTLKKWMSDVDVFLNEEWPALGDSEALEKQLEQCTVRKPPITTPKHRARKRNVIKMLTGKLLYHRSIKEVKIKCSLDQNTQENSKNNLWSS